MMAKSVDHFVVILFGLNVKLACAFDSIKFSFRIFLFIQAVTSQKSLQKLIFQLYAHTHPLFSQDTNAYKTSTPLPRFTNKI